MNTRFRLCRILFTLLLALISAFSFGQEKALDSLLKKFDRYRINFPQEKIYAHLDHDVYLTGETIWFKLYDVDGVLHRPLNISKVAYLEILDHENRAVLQTKISLKNGEGNGSLYLPASINSGNYRVRAYTHWMKNFSPDYFFQKSISVINSFRKLETGEPRIAKPFTAQFFPEGGNLVYGLKSKIAFQVLNANGKGLDCTGLILDQRNDTVATIKPFRFGIGHFMFTPLTGDTYRAQIIDSTGHVQTMSLPTPLDRGYVLEVRDSTADLLQINIHATLTNSSGVQVVYLFIHARQMISIAGTYFLNSGKASILVNKKELGEGISHITLFDGELVPQCERLYFKPSEKRLSISVNANQQEYGLRRKVILDISSISEQETASLSVAVVKTDSLQQHLSGNIFSHLWFSSDLGGTIESPEYYMTLNSKEVATAADNLMLTHGWRRFTWNDILKKKSVEPVFIPEYRGHLVRGTVLDVNSRKASGVETYLSTPGKNIQLYIARSNANGEVQYEMRDFWGSKKIIVQPKLTQDSTSQIKILSPFSGAAVE